MTNYGLDRALHRPWQLHDTDNTSAVVVKQRTREESGAHPECAGAKNGAGEVTGKQVDVHSTHGGAMVVGGDVPTTTVVKRIKQLVIEHHGIKAKLELR